MRPANPFLKMGEYLVDRIGEERLFGQNRTMKQELNTLSMGRPEAVRDYYSKKIADTLMVLTAMCVVLVVVFFTADRGSREVPGGLISRPSYGMGERQETLTVQAEGEEETEYLTLRVQEQKYTPEQVSRFLSQAEATLRKEIRGENTSLDEVRKPLYFPETLENGAVTVYWMTFPYGYILEDGSISDLPGEEGELVEIQAVLSCQEQELVYETAAMVYPPVRTEEEAFWIHVREAAADADEAGAADPAFILPEEVDGRSIRWSYPSSGVIPLFAALALVVPLLIFIRKDQQVHEKIQDRSRQLVMDYPELMWKMTMLLDAGLTIRGAFFRIAQEYGKQEHPAKRYVYEEMLYTCHEIQSGVAEGTAYENFGKRCQIPRYMKLGSILSQNLKKGSKGLAGMLEKEALSSMEEHRSIIRKMGEQAGTRLLFPMMLMFGVVIVVLIVPAFLSF